MRLVYLDEGGISNEKHEPYLVVAAAIMNPDEKWRLLEKYFQELTEEYFPRYEGAPIVFHAKDIWHGSHQFDRDRPEWPLDRRTALLKRLAEIPQKFDIPIAAGYLHRASARQTIVSTTPNISPAKVRAIIHAEAFMLVARRVEQWMAKNATNEVAMLIAEDTHEVKETIQAYHRIYTDQILAKAANYVRIQSLPENMYPDPDTWYTYKGRLPFLSKHIIDSVHFAKKDHSLLLQIADQCALIMKRKLMKKPYSDGLFALIAPQIAWRPTEGSGLGVRVKRSQIRPITQLGSIIVGDSNELQDAFKSLCAGVRSGRDKRSLSPHLQTVRAAQYQAFDTQAGRSYLGERPTLRQRVARYRKISDQK